MKSRSLLGGMHRLLRSRHRPDQLDRNKEPFHLADPGALETLIPALNHVSSTEGELEGLQRPGTASKSEKSKLASNCSPVSSWVW